MAEHRHVGSNNFNLFSSRSHTIFTLVSILGIVVLKFGIRTPLSKLDPIVKGNISTSQPEALGFKWLICIHACARGDGCTCIFYVLVKCLKITQLMYFGFFWPGHR